MNLVPNISNNHYCNIIVRHLADKLISNRVFMGGALNTVIKLFYSRTNKDGSKQAEDKYYIVKAMLKSIEKILNRGVAPAFKNSLTKIFVGDILLKRKSGVKDEFYREFGHYPPLFVLLCPTQNCNLKCIGCYTNSGGKGATLEEEIADRIITEVKELWDSNFIVLSGGEPLTYEPLFRLAEKHDNMFFMMYTNGTLINEEMAKKLAQAGNIVPAISVEGFEKETDQRRGAGVHQKILQAFANLRKAKVPFGISATATRINADAITRDEFYDYYFEEQQATFQWIFQYMPIGRAPTLELMPTPEQRLKIREQKIRMERERNYFIGDFWNDGPGCNGCISAGRQGGYFNITGEGDCTPCGFQPYAVANIREVFRTGGNLNTILRSGFFRAVREWQNEYAYRKPPQEQGDLLRVCPIRDHYRKYCELLREHQPYPIYAPAQEALQDEGYRKGMIEYDEELKALTKPIWEGEYISSGLNHKGSNLSS